MIAKRFHVLIAIFALAILQSQEGAPKLVFSPSVTQGSPLFIVARSAKPLAGSRVRIRYPSGITGDFFPAYDPRLDFLSIVRASPGKTFFFPGTGSLVAVLAGIPPDSEPGKASILLYSSMGELLAEEALEILARKYISEDIRLTPSLTGIRADPDPEKVEQALRYAALLETTNPLGLYLDSPFVKPLQSGRRTSYYGDRRRYIYSTGSVAYSMHAGIDYGVPVGTPLAAAGRGRVVMAEYRIVTGNTLVLEHLPGVYSIYMHMDTMSVAMDRIVARGERIGTTGVTGLATGPHLHWEFRVSNIPCDPEAMIGIDNFPDIGTMFPRLKGGDFYQPDYDRRQ